MSNKAFAATVTVAIALSTFCSLSLAQEQNPHAIKSASNKASPKTEVKVTDFEFTDKARDSQKQNSGCSPSKQRKKKDLRAPTNSFGSNAQENVAATCL